MKLIRPRAGDDVVNVARGKSEFRSKAVRNGLNLLHIDIRDRDQAQAIAIGFGIHHAVHLVVDAVEQAVGIDGSRYAKLGIRMAAYTRLKDDEVVRIARSERQIVYFEVRNGAADARARGLDHGRAA